MKLEKDTTISHYKIHSEIGKGGMGKIHLVPDTKIDCRIALKILPWKNLSDFYGK